jgi:soluble lytic murein transglycosylase-like protein
MRRILPIALLLCAAVAHADDRKFSAADVPGVGLHKPGKVVIRNDGNTITAFRFFGDIREALVTLRSTHALAVHPFGPAVFDSNANVAAPVYLASVFREAAQKHGVDPRLLAAVAQRESAWNPNAVSRTGACGLMQLMPATARFLGIGNIFDPRENVFGAAQYLRTLLDTFHGDLDLTLAAYNAGPGAVQRYNGVPPYRETQAYVRSVRAAYERALK